MPVDPTIAVIGSAAPVIANLDGDTIAYELGGPLPVFLDDAAAAVVTDADSADFDGGRLTASLVDPDPTTTEAVTLISIGDIGFTSNDVSIGGVVIGTHSRLSATEFVVDFNDAATPAAVSALFAAVVYALFGLTSDVRREFQFSLTDGDGGESDVASVFVDFTVPNMPPLIAKPFPSDIPLITEDTPRAITTFGISDGDPELTVTLSTDGLMSLGSVAGLTFDIGDGVDDQAMTFRGSVDDINAAIGRITYTPVLNDDGGGLLAITVDDGVNPPVSNSFGFDIAPVADAPEILSDGGGDTALLEIDENTTLVTTVAADDPDTGDTVTYKISGGDDAALFTIDSVTGALAFVDAPDFENPADDDGDNVYSVIVEASDGSLADTQEIAVTVNDVVEAIVGTPDNDLLLGTAQADTIKAGKGDDAVFGLWGSDILLGDGGRDVLLGGRGDDLLDGGKRSDLLIGGPWSDAFAFTSGLKANNIDTIVDFGVGKDRIHLDDKIFTRIGDPGDLKSKFFEKGRQADDGKDRIIYDKKSGDLFYDKDGKGGKDQVHFARLDRDLKLSEDDFLVV